MYFECIDKAEFIIEAPGNCDIIFFTIPICSMVIAPHLCISFFPFM